MRSTAAVSEHIAADDYSVTFGEISDAHVVVNAAANCFDCSGAHFTTTWSSLRNLVFERSILHARRGRGFALMNAFATCLAVLGGRAVAALIQHDEPC
jgi:hypothetical protein